MRQEMRGIRLDLNQSGKLGILLVALVISGCSQVETVPLQAASNTPQTPQPAGTGTATLSWVAPTQNTDDSPLTDLAGFRIYIGSSAAELTPGQLLSDPSATRFVVDGLAPGTWYFAVSAVNRAGIESARSSVGSKNIP
jgi:hypothetical protein